MGAIVSPLNVPKLPAKVETQAELEQAAFARSQYRLVIASLGKYRMHDLAQTPAELPTKDAEEITGEELEAHLQKVIGAVVKLEIESNRETYEGLTDVQMARIFQRLAQQNVGNLPYGPNALSPEDIQAALS